MIDTKTIILLFLPRYVLNQWYTKQLLPRCGLNQWYTRLLKRDIMYFVAQLNSKVKVWGRFYQCFTSNFYSRRFLNFKKKYLWLDCLFGLLESAHIKPARKVLVNFIGLPPSHIFPHVPMINGGRCAKTELLWSLRWPIVNCIFMMVWHRVNIENLIQKVHSK